MHKVLRRILLAERSESSRTPRQGVPAICTVLAIALCCNLTGWASLLPTTTEQHLSRSPAVFRGVVELLSGFEQDGLLYTRALLQVREVIKGKLPDKLEVVYRGGQIAGKGQSCCGMPLLKAGDEKIFFLSRTREGTLSLREDDIGPVRALVGKSESKLLKDLREKTRNGPLPGADLTADAGAPNFGLISPDASSGGSVQYSLNSIATNLNTGTDGLPARFIQPDRGQSIPYLVDADYLPAGVTVSQALWAVTTALGAWTNVSSVKFRFAGLCSFGKPAADIAADDGILRIQMHDLYNHVNGSTELGVGGNSWVIQNTASGWSTGGNVAGSDFHATSSAFVILKHTQTMLQNLATLTEVLAHEIGHALGMRHSSQNDPEPVSTLKESIMYWLVHADGRGARLNSLDRDVCRQIHPINTPPACFSRYLDVITSLTVPSGVPGLNAVQVPIYDLQSANLSFSMDAPTSGNGRFGLSGNTVSFEPSAWFADAPRYDPASGWSYDRVYVRCSDGVNASPWGVVAVVSLNSDTYSEGVPDWWRNTWFGSANPNSGESRKATDDFDGDGFSNITEFRLGSDPTNSNSNLRILSVSPTNLRFQAKPFEVYEVLHSTNLVDWSILPGAYAAESDIADVPLEPSNASREYFRVRRIP